MSNNKLNYDNIRDEHLDAMIKLAFKQADALEAQNMLAADAAYDECGAGINAEYVYELFQKKLADREAEEKRRACVARFKKGIHKFVNTAACFVLIVGITVPIAIASNESIRIRILKLLVDVRSDHTNIRLMNYDTIDMPNEWIGMYYPTYIPEGYTVTDVGELFPSVELNNEDGMYIYFDEHTEGCNVNLNSENAELSYIDINGKEALLIVRDDGAMITWAMDDRFFVIGTNSNANIIIMMAKSVQRIK